MKGQKWHGIGDYDYLLTLNEHEMRELCSFYDVDWTFFTEGPSKNWEDNYYCFINMKRKVLALLPFLSLAFGGMYGNLPLGSATMYTSIKYQDSPSWGRSQVNDREILIWAPEFSMEEFQFPPRR